MCPVNKAVDNRKNARDRNASVNSANARNKVVVAAKNVVIANKADDKPGYLGIEAAGVTSRRLHIWRLRATSSIALLCVLDANTVGARRAIESSY